MYKLLCGEHERKKLQKHTLPSTTDKPVLHKLLKLVKFTVPICFGISDFLKLNPVGFVPVLVDGNLVISDSFAIIMYLEDKFTQRPLLPSDLQKRTLNFQVAHIIASNIQPLHSVSVLNYIEEKVGPNEKLRWVQSVIRKGLTAIEILLKDHTGRYSTGDDIFLADVFLAPQIVYAATRFNVDMTEFPVLARLRETYNEVPAIREASPGNQLDAASPGN